MLKAVLEYLYYASGIILTFGVLIGIKQLSITREQIALLNKDYVVRNKRAIIESSIKYLEVAKTLIVDMADYYKKFRREVPNISDTKHLFNRDFKLENIDDILKRKELVVEILISEKLGLVHILNELEVFSVAMLNGVAKLFSLHSEKFSANF